MTSVGALSGCVIWQAIGITRALGASWPPLTAVLSTVVNPTTGPLLASALMTTLILAGAGYAIGLGLAILAAACVTVVPRLRPAVAQVAAVLNAIPVIVLGPLLITSLPRDATPIVVAALGVFFTTFVTTTRGFASADSHHVDLLIVLGANRRSQFLLLQLPSSLPAIGDSMALGAPAAILGAIIGEWFGADSGIGPMLVSAMQNFQIELLWAAALVSALASTLIYACLVGLNALMLWRLS